MRSFGLYSHLFFWVFFLCIFDACSQSNHETPLFELLSHEITNIDFENNLYSDSDFNVYKYRNFYNGGGVAVGDLNQDGLPDIYLIANREPNKLYLNSENFTFEDVTEEAGASGSMPWSTGASLVDINGNGLLDIYVTNSGEFATDLRRNELFINNGDGTFTESAKEYGLDNAGYSIHAVFFDYDLDGDLDMYLLNNSDASIVDFDMSEKNRIARDKFGGDKLYRNDNDFFTDVSEDAGIYGSEIGFSLSASISDINRDGYPDIYIANDFFEYDYLYINNRDGTFREVLKEQINSISAASMGSDIADITNNGWPDIYVADMLPETDQRIKQITTYENWELFSEKKDSGYHSQLTRNTLQLNNGNSTFSEIGRLAEVQASDWSWAVLIADFDLNGHNDILVTNGLVQDITNLDYIEEINNPEVIRSIISDDNVDYERLINMIPSTPVSNVLFANSGDLNFQNKADEWGLGTPGYSSGAAWADFDQDGDLDIIINDVKGPVRVYRNQASNQLPNRGSLTVKLKGNPSNTQAIGAQLEVWADSSYWYREHYLQRGYQSSVEPGLFVGLGNHTWIDSLKLHWPDGNISTLFDIETPAAITMQQEENNTFGNQQTSDEPAFLAGDIKKNDEFSAPPLTDITNEIHLEWSHKENNYIDFHREPLLVQMRSTEGPALCSGDVNGNGLDDIYIGGARNQSGILLFQSKSAQFIKSEPTVFYNDSGSEDTDCVFFDANGNGYNDLYVTSGGNSYSTGSSALFDRLYLNDGHGNFEKKTDGFFPPGGYSSNSTITPADFTGNGAVDLFIGERLKSFALGIPASGYLLANDGMGNFTEVSSDWSTEFAELGMITDSGVIDWDGDGLPDLVVVGEWMPPRLFRNTGSSFEELTDQLQLSDKRGLWNSIHVVDLTGNSRQDLILGNHGLNSPFRTSYDNPLKMWIADFENSGIKNQFISRSFNQKDYPFVLKHDLLEQIPSLRQKYPDYSSYSNQTIQDIFSEKQLAQSMTLQADILESIAILNKETGPEIKVLPLRAQFTPQYGIWSGDITGDEHTELLMTGNLLEVKPMAGPFDAGYGTLMKVHAKQPENPVFQTLPVTVSGLSVKGAGRKIISVRNSSGEQIIIIARNNAAPVFYKINR